ncbi:MAG TPA: dihydrodipicolinate synthase family protein [Pyrinomonadaceae bacterium]|nr:dihydrodipicolinate synthase family protein [Pyrinomonadaceae bacterium]
MTRQFSFDALRGILLPTTTPFHPDGSILTSAIRANLKKWTTRGVTGFVVLGSTGERVHLDESEYLQVVEVSRAAVSDEFVFIAGAGQHSTRGTINEVRKAAEAGADAVLVITPHYYRSAMNQETLRGYYAAVADASPVPVLLYSMPALTGIKIDPETIARLSEHPNIAGVKDSSNDVAGFAETVRLCPDDFAVMTGNGTVLLDTLRAGATGGILAVGCVVPEVCVEIFRAFDAGETERAEALQSKLTPLAAAVTTKFGIGGLKGALGLAGYQGGAVRAPLQGHDYNAHKEIAALLEEFSLRSSASSAVNQPVTTENAENAELNPQVRPT